MRTFFRRVGGEGPPAVFVHGNPTHSEDWLPFLERLDGPALALDLPGWGFSERPDRGFDYSMHGLARFFGRFLDRARRSTSYSLVVHDWGSVGLIDGPAPPERACAGWWSSTPCRCCRATAGTGSRATLARAGASASSSNLTTTRPALRLLSRQARRGRGRCRTSSSSWRCAAAGRAPGPRSLALYRSADPERLAAAGERLGRLDCPALVVWGAQDPYLPLGFGRAYAERLPDAELVELDGAGHWPWLDRPELIDRVRRFLACRPESA